MGLLKRFSKSSDQHRDTEPRRPDRSGPPEGEPLNDRPEPPERLEATRVLAVHESSPVDEASEPPAPVAASDVDPAPSRPEPDAGEGLETGGGEEAQVEPTVPDPAEEPPSPQAEAGSDEDDEESGSPGLLRDPKLLEIRRREDELREPERRLTADEALSPARPTFGTPPAGRPEEQDAERPAERPKVIAFANQKGGVAKTTTTLNLGVAFAESGHRVLCIDMDPQGNLTMSQGIDPDKVDVSMYDVLVHKRPLREAIQSREIDIACASIDLAGAEIAMSTQIGRERSLEKALEGVAGDYDFVCIDTPPSLGLLTINALTAADNVIVPVQCEYLSMRGLVQLQNTLAMIRENLNPDVQIEGILPTMMDTRTVHAKEAIEILEENFGELVFQTRIRKTIKFAEAPVRGTSVLKYDPEGKAAGYYRELAREVMSSGS